MMRVVDSAVAAMDAHRGVAAVAEHGLCFLRNVSLADSNRVSRQVMGVFAVIWGWVVGAGGSLLRGVPLTTRVWWLAVGWRRQCFAAR